MSCASEPLKLLRPSVVGGCKSARGSEGDQLDSMVSLGILTLRLGPSPGWASSSLLAFLPGGVLCAPLPPSGGAWAWRPPLSPFLPPLGLWGGPLARPVPGVCLGVNVMVLLQVLAPTVVP